MAIFGFIIAIIIMLIVTFYMGIILMYGGLDIGPLNAKSYRWYLPLLCVVIWLWYIVISNAPFTININ